MVRINRITKDIPATVVVKIETTNPGNSIKDRMALKMIEDAEASGKLKPGGTIIEGTSGNTGMGLAIAAVVKGYKCIFTTTDKQSKEKVDALRAFGAEVIVCPTDVDPEDPRSYYSVSSRLERETPNGWKANQYDNPSNATAHYEQTGPEIWEQTDGKITHLVVGVGTGGATGVLGSIVVVRWFTSNRGFVIGVLSNASAAGQLLFYPLLMAVSLAFGWRAAFMIFAVMGAAAAVSYYVFSTDRPRQAGRPASLLEAVSLFRYQVMWAIGGIQFVRFFVALGIGFWMPSFLVSQHGFTIQQAGLMVAVGAAFTVPVTIKSLIFSDSGRTRGKT